MSESSERIRFVTHQGKRILQLDYSGCSAASVMTLLQRARAVIGAEPLNSLLTLTDVTSLRFDKATTEAFQEYLAHNKPYVRAAAVVGVAGLTRAVLEVYRIATRRDFVLFDSRDKAKEWLAQLPSAERGPRV